MIFDILKKEPSLILFEFDNIFPETEKHQYLTIGYIFLSAYLTINKSNKKSKKKSVRVHDYEASVAS